MAGSGIALTAGVDAVDLNPAGLAEINDRTLVFSQYADYHFYSIDNVRKEENLARIFEWNKIVYRPQSLLAAWPINQNFSVAFGYINRISPYLFNQRRAITWSPLFHQETSGSVHSLLFSIAYRLSEQLSIGASTFLYYGLLMSNVHGENHGNDTDKWAKLENEISGAGFKTGIKYKLGVLQAGLVLEMPVSLNVNTEQSISDDMLYAYLLPDYKSNTFHLPLNIGLGLAWFANNALTLAFDYELRDYKSSSLQLNLYEYGGKPNWKDIHIFRFGIIYIDQSGEWLPVQFGYAFIPQLYASNTSQGIGNSITSYQDKNQNIKHLFTLGTAIDFSFGQLNLTYKYAVINWHRDLYSYITVKEDYTEDIYSLSTTFTFKF